MNIMILKSMGWIISCSRKSSPLLSMEAKTGQLCSKLILLSPWYKPVSHAVLANLMSVISVLGPLKSKIKTRPCYHWHLHTPYLPDESCGGSGSHWALSDVRTTVWKVAVSPVESRIGFNITQKWTSGGLSLWLWNLLK